MNIKSMIIPLVLSTLVTSNAVQALELSDNCVVNILNRTIQVSKEGGWALPNVPSNMGKVRARATCSLPDGSTVSGQSDYFTLTNNAITKVGEIKFEGQAQIPSEINFSPSTPITLRGIEKTTSANVSATFADGSTQDVTASTSGITYTSTNPATATVSSEGLITAKSNGSVLINASKDGVMASLRVTVITSGDLDKDGLPDDWEVANGLNPADPIDAYEDIDGDKLSALEEFKESTNPNKPDSDADGLYDAIEINQTKTNPILADTDGDDLNDQLELKLTNSDPLKATSANYAAALTAISVTPPTLTLTFNGVDTEVSTQLTVTGKLIDGSTIDLTKKSRGTTYSSSNVEVVNFGIVDGRVFGGKAGNAVITVKNGEYSYPLAIVVETFTPGALSAIDIPGYANNVKVSSDTAYVAAGAAGLHILDISNRKAPRIVGSLDTDGTAIDLRVRGNHIYLADGEGGLKIIDATVPTTPKLLGSLKTAGITQDLQIYSNYAYLANGTAGIEIVDISNPASPVSISTLENLGTVKGIDADSNTIFIVNETALISIDALFKESPTRIGALNLGPTKDLTINNGYAHVAVSSLGYRIVDIKDPAEPFVVSGDRAIEPRDVVINKDLAFYAEELFVNDIGFINIDSPTTPLFQGTISLQNFEKGYGGTGIDVDSTYAYVTKARRPVGVDYNSTGSSKLFIAQYRAAVDNAGQAPEITLLSPSQGDVVVENATLNVRAQAQDDVAIKQVEFFADDISIGIDSTAPYEVSYTVPAGKRFVVLKAQATDLAYNTAVSELVRINIQPDKDRDSLGNDDEVELYNTNPNIADTDQDGLYDGKEITLKTDPLKSDSDGDGISDGEEYKQQTDPLNPDITAPLVESTNPTADILDVPENQGIRIKFNEPILARSVNSSTFSLKQQGAIEVTGNLKVESEREILFTPSSMLKDYTKYTVHLSGIRDSAGNLLSSALEYNFTTGNTIDRDRPYVISTSPNYDSGAAIVAPNSTLALLMSEPIDPTSVGATGMYVIDRTTSERISGSLSVSEDNLTIRFAPDRDFLVGRDYLFWFRGIKDKFGNEISFETFRNEITFENGIYFSTSLINDRLAPTVKSSSVNDGQTAVPLNVRIRVQFDEPIDAKSLKLIKIFKNGIEVPIEQRFETNNSLISLKPLVSFAPESLYELRIGSIEDLSGNVFKMDKSISFTTSGLTDSQEGIVETSTPAADATSVPLNTSIELALNEPVDPTTVTAQSLYLTDLNEGRKVEGHFEFSDNGQHIAFIPIEPLKPAHRYTINANSIYGYDEDYFNDLSGNRFRNWVRTFTTGLAIDSAPPTLSLGNVAQGATGVPLNPQLSFVFDEQLNSFCVNDTTVSLRLKSDNTNIPGVVALVSGGRRITFEPNSPLASNTSYQLIIEGVCDLSNNKISNKNFTFTTSADTKADKIAPTLKEITPNALAANLQLNSTITATFDESIDPTKLDKLSVKGLDKNGFYFGIAGNWSPSGNKLTFTPLNDLPPNAPIYVILQGVADMAGNTGYYDNIKFQTASGEDKKAPQIESITPANGTMDVGPHNPIVVTFTESMQNSTLNRNNIFLYIDGQIQSNSLYLSPDNRTVTILPTLPAAKLVTLVITSDVKDLANNAMADFASTFSTALINTDLSRPRISRQTPVSGASKVRNNKQIHLYANEQLNAATITQGVYVAADGVLVPGSLSLDSTGQVVTFTSTSSLPENSLIEIFATENVRDNSGNALINYHSSFRTGSNTGSTPGLQAKRESVYPEYGQLDVSLNPAIDLAFSEVLDPNTITPDNIKIRQNYTSMIVQSLLTLSEDGHRIRIKPTENLKPATQYIVEYSSNIRDIDGDKVSGAGDSIFSTGANASIDTQRPVVVKSSPVDGTTDIPVNPTFHIGFDEPINPLSFDPQGNDQISFLEGNREIRYVKDHALQSNKEHTETFSGIEDTSGNTVLDFRIRIKTSEQVDLIAPDIARLSPKSLSVNVPLNTALKIEFDEPVSPISINSGGIYLYDQAQGKNVPTSLSLSADGKLLTVTPNAPLAVSQTYDMFLYYLQDFAQNYRNKSFTFKTGAATDTVPPTIQSLSISDGQTAVPLNARLRVRFNEPINIQKLQGFTLSLNGMPVPSNISLSDDRLLLTLTPNQLLMANTSYVVSASGFEDISGNRLEQPITRRFTTAAKVDSYAGSVNGMTPAADATNVPLNARIELTLNEPVDPTTVTARSFFLYDTSESRDIEGRFEVSASAQSLTFTPSQPLKPAHSYSIRANYSDYFYDLAGNKFSGWYKAFTTGSQ